MPWWVPAAQAGASVVSGLMGSDAAEEAAEAQLRGQNQALAYQRESRDIAMREARPYIQSSQTALDRMMGMTGLPRPVALEGALADAQVIEPTARTQGPSTFSSSQVPITEDEFQALSRVWPEINVAASFGDIDWSRHGGEPNISDEARRFLSQNWGNIRSAARMGDINWEASTGRRYDPSSGAVAASTLPAPSSSAPTTTVPPQGAALTNATGGVTIDGATGKPIVDPSQAPEPDITTDPSYQFVQDEAMRALENSAAARGGLMSGGFGRQALRYASNLASQEYSNIFNRLSAISGHAQTTPSTVGTALNFGANAGSIAGASGDARASGYIAQSNAWQNTMDQIALALGSGFGGGNTATSTGRLPSYGTRMA